MLGGSRRRGRVIYTNKARPRPLEYRPLRLLLIVAKFRYQARVVDKFANRVLAILRTIATTPHDRGLRDLGLGTDAPRADMGNDAVSAARSLPVFVVIMGASLTLTVIRFIVRRSRLGYESRVCERSPITLP